MSDKTFPIARFKNGSQMASLYYYNGNFFYPVFLVSRELEGRVRRLCAMFEKANKDLVASDRAHPDYMTKLQIAEAQGL
jgi:hypothetical protein